MSLTATPRGSAASAETRPLGSTSMPWPAKAARAFSGEAHGKKKPHVSKPAGSGPCDRHYFLCRVEVQRHFTGRYPCDALYGFRVSFHNRKECQKRSQVKRSIIYLKATTGMRLFSRSSTQSGVNRETLRIKREIALLLFYFFNSQLPLNIWSTGLTVSPSKCSFL